MVKKIVTTQNAGHEAEKMGHSNSASENLKGYSHSGKQMGSFLKKLNVQLLYDPAIVILHLS